MSVLVFVFGTLKEGFPNFATNNGTRLPGVYTTREPYPFYLVGERYSPWLINMPGHGTHVSGQVFVVGEATLAQMDILERIAEPDGYQRALIEVVPDSSAQASALSVFAYLKAPEHLADTKIQLGPLDNYTLEHAALYRKRG